MNPRPIRLVVVDDSAFVRKALVRLFEGSEDIEVVGSAGSGEALLANLQQWNPDAITLDLMMPGMGGLAALDRVLEWRRVPVIILSTHTSRQAPLTIEALHRGAVDFIDKQALSLVDFAALRNVLTEKLAGVTRREEALPAASSQAPRPVAPPARGAYELLLIGASTGGPPAIETILHDMGRPAVPVAIVQHMPIGFTAAFADRLNGRLGFPVREARHATPIPRGEVHIAPAGMHLRLVADHGGFTSMLARFPEDVSHRPSVDVLFQSIVAAAPSVLAVLLTGMGTDGAKGLLELVSAGAMTIVQDEATSIVWGMPKAAAQLRAAREEIPLHRIGRRIAELTTANVAA